MGRLSPSTSSSPCASGRRSRGALLERLPNLKLLVTTGRRNKSIDIEAANDRGITVCGTGILPNGTAELTWGLILAVTRHIPQEDAAVRAGGWQQTIGGDLAGARLGVVGLGGQGSQVARIGQAFGMDVVAWSQNLTDERAAEHGVRRVERRALRDLGRRHRPPALVASAPAASSAPTTSPA